MASEDCRWLRWCGAHNCVCVPCGRYYYPLHCRSGLFFMECEVAWLVWYALSRGQLHVLVRYGACNFLNIIFSTWCYLCTHLFMLRIPMFKFALMPVIYEIAYINPLLRRQTNISVILSRNGFPNKTWHTAPVKSDFELLLAIGRVGLMARFMRTFVLTHTSSSSRFLRIYHPRFWFRRSKNLKQQLSSPQRAQKNSQRGESSRTVNRWVSTIMASELTRNNCWQYVLQSIK